MGAGLNNDERVRAINVSGSLAIEHPNDMGVRLFNSGSSGIIAGRLIKPIYNTSELKKSVDLTIQELIPVRPAQVEDVVLRSVFNSATQSIIDLTNQVQGLNETVLSLNSKIALLETVSESLKIELDGERLRAGIFENQAFVSNNQVSSTVIDLQNAIQTSLNESIDRISLQARNEILQTENDNLRNQLYGINTQLNTGAVSGINNKFTAKYTGLGEDGDTLVAVATHKGLPTSAKFKSGNRLQINNVVADLDIVSVTFNTFDGAGWFKVVSGNQRIPLQGQYLYDIIFDTTVISKLRPFQRRGIITTWEGQRTTYPDTKLRISVTFEDGSTDVIILNSSLQKDRN